MLQQKIQPKKVAALPKSYSAPSVALINKAVVAPVAQPNNEDKALEAKLETQQRQLASFEDSRATLQRQISNLEAKNSKLVKENKQLKMEREILKKAAAFFAKESG